LKTFTALLASCLLLWVSGCGGSSTTMGYSPKSKERMGEVANMYNAFLSASKGGLPKKLSDLDPFEPANQYGYAGIRDGEIIMTWGGSKSAESASIVQAHDKNAGQSGGHVLMQDGTVKEMSAAEFNSAKKAK
jgi:hypothetical protein